VEVINNDRKGGSNKNMKYLIGSYVVMAIMVFVNWTSVFIFHDKYSAIASWLIVMLFFANARYYLSKK